MSRNSLLFSFVISAAMGCGGDNGAGESSKVVGASSGPELEDFFGAPPTRDFPHPPGETSGTEENSGGSAGTSGDFKLPESGWGLAGVILGLVGLIAGCVLLYRGNLRWGIPLALAGLAAFVAVLGWGGLSLSPPWEWHLVFWVLLVAWCLAKATTFTRWDDRIVVLGSLGMLVLTFVGRGILGKYAPGSPLWWALECVWVFLIAEAIWRSPQLQARPLARYGCLAVGWILLGVLS